MNRRQPMRFACLLACLLPLASQATPVCGLEIGNTHLTAVALDIQQRGKVADIQSRFEATSPWAERDNQERTSQLNELHQQLNRAAGRTCPLLISAEVAATAEGSELLAEISATGRTVETISTAEEMAYLWQITAAPRVAQTSILVDLGPQATRIGFLTDRQHKPDTTTLSIGSANLAQYLAASTNAPADMENFIKTVAIPQWRTQEKLVSAARTKPHVYWSGLMAAKVALSIQPERKEKHYAIISRSELETFWTRLTSQSSEHPDSADQELQAALAIIRGALSLTPAGTTLTIPIKHRPWIYGYLLEKTERPKAAPRQFIVIN